MVHRSFKDKTEKKLSLISPFPTRLPKGDGWEAQPRGRTGVGGHGPRKSARLTPLPLPQGPSAWSRPCAATTPAASTWPRSGAGRSPRPHSRRGNRASSPRRGLLIPGASLRSPHAPAFVPSTGTRFTGWGGGPFLMSGVVSGHWRVRALGKN